MKPLTSKEVFLVCLFLYDQSATVTVATLAVGIASHVVPILLVADEMSGIIYFGIPLFCGFAVAASIIMLPFALLRRFMVERSHSMANKLLAYKHGLQKA